MTDTLDSNALNLFQEEQRALAALLGEAREPDTPAAEEAARQDPAARLRQMAHLRELLPDIRQRLLRYCQLEMEVLSVALAKGSVPPPAVVEAQRRCELAQQFLEQLEAVSARTDRTFRAGFDTLSRHVLEQMERTASVLLAPGPAEATAVQPAGRLDVGTAEDRNPPL